jgi:hypothetical protein
MALRREATRIRTSRAAIAVALALASVLLSIGVNVQTSQAAELSAPAAASPVVSRYDLVVRGQDGMLFHKYWENGTGPVNGWSAWGSIGQPPVGSASSPSVSSPEQGVIQVFVRGNDNQIWNNHWTHGQGGAPGGWSGWGAVPKTGNATWAPAASFGKDNQPDVFYRGTDGAIWYTRFDTTLGWTAPVSLGGYSMASPAVTTNMSRRLQVVVEGSDNRVYLKWADDPNAWSAWEQIPNALTSMAPTVTTQNEGQFHIFFRGYSDATMYDEYCCAPVNPWVGPGAIPNVSLVSSPAAIRMHVFYRSSEGDVLETYYDPSLGWTSPTSKGQPQTDFKLYREQSSNATFLVEDDERFWVTSPEVAQAAGLDLSTTEVVPNGSLNSIPRGEDITMNSLAWEEVAPDPGTATTAGSSWKSHGEDKFNFETDNGVAEAAGQVKWFHGRFPSGHRHRVEPSGIVYAFKPVGCIWAKFSYWYLTGSVSLPPSGSISGAEKDSGYFVKCRAGNATIPSALNLGGLGYAKALLESATLTICTSTTKSEGPRWCTHKRMWYFNQ